MSSSSLRNALIPGTLVLVESTWASVLLGAVVHGPAGGHADVPFVALFVPALLAVGAGVMISARLASIAARLMVAVLPGLAAMVLGALTYDTVVLGGNPGDVLHPWVLVGPPGRAVTIALVCGGLAALRGASAGLFEPRVRSVLCSLGLGTAVMGITLVVAALHRGAAFEAAGRDAATLLVLAVPSGVAVLGLVRERQLELAGAGRSMRRAGSGALFAVAAPIGLLVLLALLAVVIGSAVAPPVGHGLVAAGRGIGTLIGELFGLLGHVHLHVKLHPKRPSLPPSSPPLGRLRALRHAGGPAPWWLLAVLALIAALIVTAVVVMIVRALRGRPGRPARTPTIGEETRDSVFSFAHLFAQLRSALSRRPGADEPQSTQLGPPEQASVHRHYRRLLVALRERGLGRRATETPEELAARLAGASGEAELSLTALTEIYEAARYGEDPRARGEVARAGELADLALGVLVGDGGDIAGVADRRPPG